MGIVMTSEAAVAVGLVLVTVVSFIGPPGHLHIRPDIAEIGLEQIFTGCDQRRLVFLDEGITVTFGLQGYQVLDNLLPGLVTTCVRSLQHGERILPDPGQVGVDLLGIETEIDFSDRFS